jgi:hypothetical protein
MAMESNSTPRMHHHGAFPIITLLGCFLLRVFSMFLLGKRTGSDFGFRILLSTTTVLYLVLYIVTLLILYTNESFTMAGVRRTAFFCDPLLPLPTP